MNSRDLKLDNTLLDDSNPPLLKLCDFGFAKTWDAEDANMYTHIGWVTDLVQPAPLSAAACWSHAALVRKASLHACVRPAAKPLQLRHPLKKDLEAAVHAQMHQMSAGQAAPTLICSRAKAAAAFSILLCTLCLCTFDTGPQSTFCSVVLLGFQMP